MNAKEESNQKMIQIDGKQLTCLLTCEFQRLPAEVVIPFRVFHTRKMVTLLWSIKEFPNGSPEEK